MVGPDATSRTRFIENAKTFVLEGFNHGNECKAIHYTRCGIYIPHMADKCMRHAAQRLYPACAITLNTHLTAKSYPL